MRQTIMNRLRSADGRGLATALACLILAVALIGGVHSGAAAGGEAAGVFCGHIAGGHTTRGPAGEQPATGHDDLCCIAGCLMHAPALDVPPQSLPRPMLAGSITLAAISASSAARRDGLSDHRQRGPPSLA